MENFYRAISQATTTIPAAFIYSTFNELIDKVSYGSDWHFSLLMIPMACRWSELTQMESQIIHLTGIQQQKVLVLEHPAEKIQYIPVVYNGSFSFTNNVFSPDSDGFEDVLQVTYEMNEEGLLGQVSIYDDKGRIIKNLFSNELMGSSGSFTWDGTTNDGVKAIGVSM